MDYAAVRHPDATVFTKMIESVTGAIAVNVQDGFVFAGRHASEILLYIYYYGYFNQMINEVTHNDL